MRKNIGSTVVFTIVLHLSLTWHTVEALSTPSPPDIEYRQFVQFTNPINTRVQQSIPASFVRDWSTWVLDENGILSKIPDDDGFVQPSSIDELWQPVDLKRPEIKLALGLHIREGVIRHVMPAVDLSFGGGTHRNRGVCSVPRAHSWIDFSLSLDEWESYKIVLSAKEDKADPGWTELLSSQPGDIAMAIERATLCLSEAAPDEFGSGSHIMNVVLTNSEKAAENLECPRNEMKVIMEDDDFIDDAQEPSGALQVVISPSIAGSESNYLPDAYKALYEDESLRNPLYEAFKKRQEERSEEKHST